MRKDKVKDSYNRLYRSLLQIIAEISMNSIFQNKNIPNFASRLSKACHQQRRDDVRVVKFFEDVFLVQCREAQLRLGDIYIRLFLDCPRGLIGELLLTNQGHGGGIGELEALDAIL